MRAPASKISNKLSHIDPAEFTPQFRWRRESGYSDAPEHVVCEDLPLAHIAEKFGTPAYLYSRAAIESAFRGLDRGLRGLPHTVCFSVKSNGNLSILRLLARLDSGFDIVSGGELERLRRAGVRGDRIVFSGVGKTREEIREALRYPPAHRGSRPGILLFNVESEAELDLLAEESARCKRRGEGASVAVRVNPDVLAGGHPHIATGKHHHKFGLNWPAARRLYCAHGNSRWFRWQGISAHIGSQVLSLDPFRRALRRLARHFLELRSAGIELRYFDFGGGLGVRYTDQQPPARDAYARMVRDVVRPLRCHLLLEPGRSIVAQAGVLLTRGLYTKENRRKTFVIVDAAMNDLMRPALYDAVHPITRVTREPGSGAASRKPVDIVGPVCETGDCFLHDWPLERVQSGDVLAIWGAGAYGMALASNYNARPRAVEVLVEGKRTRFIRRRETHAELMREELSVLR